MDSKSRRTAKLPDRFKSYSNFTTVFFKKKSNTSKKGMWGVYLEAIDRNIALLTWISFWVSVSEEKALSEPKNLQNGPHLFKCFWDPTLDMVVQNEI